MSWARAPRRPDDHRHAHLAAEHVADLGGVVHDHVLRDEDEVDRHDLDDRAQTEHRGADPGPDEALLRDRGLAHALGAVLLPEPGGDLVRAFEAADLLAHQEHALIALELLVESTPERFAIGHFCQDRVSSRSPNGAAVFMAANCSRH